MKEFCMIEIAFDNEEEVKKVVDELLREKLIAGAQVVMASSSWNWRGIREESPEYLVFVKTRVSLAKEIYDKVRLVHSYETFEFAMFDLSSYSKDYLNWLNSVIKKG